MRNCHKFSVAFLLLLAFCVSPAHSKVCESIPKELADNLVAGNVLIFGEQHGSKETPKHMYNVICNALESDKKVLFGLESSAENLPAYKKALAMADKEKFTAEILNELAWGDNPERQTGQHSLALFRLLESISDLMLENKKIDIFTFDADVVQIIDDMTKRDFFMAQNVLNIAKENSDALVIILTGSFHSHTETIAIGDTSYEPMGKFIKASRKDTHFITFRYDDSIAWVCTNNSGCGAQERKSNSEGINKSIEFSQSDASNQHQWDWYIGTMTASPPAVSELLH